MPTTIEWTRYVRPDGVLTVGHTVNTWVGCERYSPGCLFCYAETFDRRHLRADTRIHWGRKAPRLIELGKAKIELLRIARRGDRSGYPELVFMHSHSDFFEDRPELVDPRRQIVDFIGEINAQRVRLLPLILTKRAEEMADFALTHGLPQGVALGVSVEDQARLDKRAPLLASVGDRVWMRFWSAEPLLSPLDMHAHLNAQGGPDWIIVGGESGVSARPMASTWVDDIAKQAEDHGRSALFFKQWGNWAPDAHGNMTRVASKSEIEPRARGRVWRDTPNFLQWSHHGPNSV